MATGFVPCQPLPGLRGHFRGRARGQKTPLGASVMQVMLPETLLSSPFLFIANAIPGKLKTKQCY